MYTGFSVCGCAPGVPYDRAAVASCVRSCCRLFLKSSIDYHNCCNRHSTIGHFWTHGTFGCCQAQPSASAPTPFQLVQREIRNSGQVFSCGCSTVTASPVITNLEPSTADAVCGSTNQRQRQSQLQRHLSRPVSQA